ncbi:phage major capsid protein [Pseudonocardia sp. MH-G8]|uniref:phage major capsid protein n=1 Tax=Pseudonocardia sp. MH-G8 TaxID=1854588 RepID=UPI00117A024A|nr:phage major capsid protein [Pseudonocardia sp. MH-G8]
MTDKIYSRVAAQIAANATDAARREGGSALERVTAVRDATGSNPINDEAVALVAGGGLQDRADVILDEVARIDRHERPTRAQRERRDVLLAEAAELERARVNAERAALRQYLTGGGAVVERGTPVNETDGYDRDPFGADGGRRSGPELMRHVGDPWAERIATFGRSPAEVAAQARSIALAAVERVPDVPDAARDRFTRYMDTERGEPMGKVARWIRATSDPDYRAAWCKLAVDPGNGHRMWTDAELKAAQFVDSEARAMNLTDSSGGYLVPFQLDPTVLLTNDGTTGVIRQIARTVVATGDVWNGVSSAGVTANWYAEAAEVSDDSPTLAQPSIQVHRSSAFVPVSFEAFDDAASIAQEVSTLLTDALFRLDEQAFTTGSGSGQPFGIVTALTGTTSEVNQAGTTLDAADWFALQNALPPRFQQNASWITHLVSMNTARATPIASGLDSPVLQEGNPPTILGKPVYEANYMDSTVTATESDHLAVYGSFENFIVADRIGMTIELVPHLFGAAGRPSGQRGWFAWRRCGADVVVPNAFRMLDKSD